MTEITVMMICKRPLTMAEERPTQKQEGSKKSVSPLLNGKTKQNDPLHFQLTFVTRVFLRFNKITQQIKEDTCL